MSDSELWNNVLQGDGKAWTELIRRYGKLVYAVACRSGLTMMDAADCFQQTWVLLHRNRKKLRDPERLAAWLVTTAKREALRLLKQAAGNPEHIYSLRDEKAVMPDEEMEILERQSQLEVALDELNPRCRKILELFFFASKEKSYEDIAKILGVSPNSLGPIRRRCLEQLKKILIKNGFPGVRKRR